MVSVNAVPKREEFCCGHGEEAQVVGSLLGQRQADEPAAVAGHEVDRLRGHKLGGQSQVALVFAVFVVDHDHHAASANLGQRAGDIGKRGFEGAGVSLA